jgi:LysM repeat protein
MTYRRTTMVLVAICVLFSGWTLNHSIQAAPETQNNLLTNPGFEDPFVPYLGDTTRMVADGWSAWHVPQRTGDEGFRNLKPEYQPASASNPDRILEGSNAQEYFSFFATHTGGVYQQVSVPAGSSVVFSVYVYAWSTQYDDVNLSEDPGRVQIQVGIDPNGGTDGESERVIWSLPLEFYDEYRQVIVSAEDVGSLISVFVRTSYDLPQKNNNIYLDNASLVITSTAQPTNTPTATLTATPIPPTATPLPPSATPLPITTATPTFVPSATNTVAPGMATPTQEVDDTSEIEPSSTPISSEFPYQVLHTVVAGDVVSRLAQQYGSTVEAIIQANGLNSEALIYVDQILIIPVAQEQAPTPQPTLAPTSIGIIPTSTPIGIIPTAVAPTPAVTQAPSSGFTTYTVQSGDTLSSISRRYNSTIATIAQLNGILNPNLIRVGQVLTVPGTAQPTPPPAAPAPTTPTTHVVQPGENLYRISLRYRVSLLALASANGISNPDRIFVGQVLTLP